MSSASTIRTDHSARAGHPGATRPRPRRRHRVPGPDADAVVLAVDLVLTGPGRHSDALDLLDAVRAVAATIPDAAVRLRTGPPAPTSGPPPVGPATDPDGIEVDRDARTVTLASDRFELTRREFDLLAFLAAHPRRVFTRTHLLRQVWGHAHTGDRTVDVHIRRLRAKLGRTLISTVRGVGYRLADGARVRVTGADGRAGEADGPCGCCR